MSSDGGDGMGMGGDGKGREGCVVREDWEMIQGGKGRKDRGSVRKGKEKEGERRW